ncbi:MAG: acyclic terpene utilization AtuA family protein, partial [Alphaproteobacteria bacterium]|nr:acyclic terpene utilization AtuA family protein [Alphaproteobacteria bacterium]
MGRDSIRIGCGAGFSGDRIDPAVALAERGKLDFLVFECLAERTIALAARSRRDDPEAGYDPLLEERLSAVLPAAIANKIRIISNMGAANPLAAARAVAAIVRRLGLGPLKIAAVTGDDVLAQISPNSALLEGGTVVEWPGELIAANAYL